MKDVATIAGVSVSTVSRVINNTLPVDARTRELVERAIRKVSYRPNLLASGLRSKSGNLIGLAVPEIAHQSFDNFIKHTEEFARANKYGLILGDIHNDPDGEADFIDQLIRRNVDGIIFIRVSDESRALEMLNRTTIPYVVLDRGVSTATAPTVVMDNYQAGRLAAEHLIALGHRNVACVTGPLNVSLCRDRLDGFTQTLSAAGLRILRSDIHESDFQFDSGVELVPGILERNPSLTAVWAQNDLMAIGIMAGLRDHGLDVPGDVSVLGVDDISACRMLRPQLTTVKQPFREMSRAAVDLLLRESALGERISEKIVIPTELVIRQSTAPPRDLQGACEQGSRFSETRHIVVEHAVERSR
ncbi:MAG: LacI family transcriptional regulator [Spirochaetaceae bacterium]|nr:MAG: LacI family transcriptional regulator [Spirochaetaceae bacterium]